MKRVQIANTTENRQQSPASDQRTATHEATILSVNADATPNTFRVSLQWPGNYDIADFDLQRFGRVVAIQDETPNTGWALIERPLRGTIEDTLLGLARLNDWTCPLSPGETIPLRPDLRPWRSDGPSQAR